MSSVTQILLREAVQTIKRQGKDYGLNVVAFSGGVDSSLAATLVKEVFPQNCVAVTGVSPSLPQAQLKQAEQVAAHIGIPFQTVRTRENEIKEYRENLGQSCYYCKKTLYTALEELDLVDFDDLEDHSYISQFRSKYQFRKTQVNWITLFNGTNKDDLEDKTRVGLTAALEFSVCSPLAHMNKYQVRELAAEYDLPNHDTAASPCLRSRLAKGVEASLEHLHFVEEAELAVKELLQLNPTENMRVRLLSGQRYRLEVDKERLGDAENKLQDIVKRWNVDTDKVELSLFQSGSVAAHSSVES